MTEIHDLNMTDAKYAALIAKGYDPIIEQQLITLGQNPSDARDMACDRLLQAISAKVRTRRNRMKEMTIETLEEKLRQAMLNSDVLALDELIADDLVFTTHTGLVMNKQADLEAHRSGIQKLTKIDSSDRQIQYYTDCAVVTVKMELAGTYNEQALDGTYRYTRVWAKLQERWQVVVGHLSQVISL